MRGNASPGEPRSAVVAAIIFQVIVTQALKTGNKERIDQMSRRAIAEERSEWHSRAMLRPGKRNLITDVDGIRIGNAEDNKVWTGVTVILPDAPALAAVDVRGGAPGTRETDALDLRGRAGSCDCVERRFGLRARCRRRGRRRAWRTRHRFRRGGGARADRSLRHPVRSAQRR